MFGRGRRRRGKRHTALESVVGRHFKFTCARCHCHWFDVRYSGTQVKVEFKEWRFDSTLYVGSENESRSSEDSIHTTHFVCPVTRLLKCHEKG